MNENYLYLVKGLLNCASYHSYRRYITIDRDVNKDVYIIYKTLDELMEKYKRDLTIEELIVTLQTNYPNSEIITELIKIVQESEISNEVFLEAIKKLQERYDSYQLALLSLEVSEGRKTYEELKDAAQKLATNKLDLEEKENPFVSDDLEYLYDSAVRTPGLRWRLGTLNRMLGSLRKGDFGFIFARPETGKTTFLASEITNFAQQTTSPILWFNNEEQGSKVAVRCYQAALGVSLTELYSNLGRNREEYYKLTNGNIKIYDSASIHRRDVESLCKEYKPSLIIFDQIDKIKGFTDDREDLRLGHIYIWARELAKEYAPVIGVTQAGAEAEGRKWLNMDMVANARTAKQAEADWILGIGKTHDGGFEFVRYLHASKNKLPGDEDSVPELRHGKLEVLIRPDIARYEDFQ